MLEEILKIISKEHIEKEELISLVPILKQLDEFDFYHPVHIYNVLDHSIKAAESLDDPILRLIMIFHDVGKLKTSIKVPHYTIPGIFVTKSPGHEKASAKITYDFFKDRMDPKCLKTVVKLIEYHDTKLVKDDDDSIMKKLVDEYGAQFVEKLLKIQKADMSHHEKQYYEKELRPTLENAQTIFTRKYDIK